MRGLKALVIIMGVLILAGLAVIVVTLIDRNVGIDRNLGIDRNEGRDGSPTPSTASYETKITLPAGARIVETETSDTRLIIRLRLAGGASRLLIIDPATGQRIGTINLPQSAR